MTDEICDEKNYLLTGSHKYEPEISMKHKT